MDQYLVDLVCAVHQRQLLGSASLAPAWELRALRRQPRVHDDLPVQQ